MEKIYRLPLKQNIGAVPAPVVAVGQRVNRGTVLARPEGEGLCLPLHASVSGIVREVTETHIAIQADAVQGEDFERLAPTGDIVAMVKAAGICGMGGAGFPTYVKLGTRLDGGTLIVNAVECEPVLHHNITQIVAEPTKIRRGLLLAMEATGAARGIIAIKSKNEEAVRALQDVMHGMDAVSVLLLPDRYPMGEERAIVREALHTLLCVDQLPAAAGAVIINAETTSRIAEAVDDRRPVISKHLTLAGKLVQGSGPRILMDVPLGTAVRDVLETAGGIAAGAGDILMGGPFTGRRATLDDVVIKTTGGILVADAWQQEPLPLGILVCACGPNGLRMREIARDMGAEVAGVQVCKHAQLVKGTLKCANPGICPGQREAVETLCKAGAKALLLGNCFDCTRDIMGYAPQMGLRIHHATDAVMRGMGLPLVRGQNAP